MPRDSKRFETIHRLAEKKEHDAAALLAQARRERDQARQRLQELEVFRREYLEGHGRVSAIGSPVQLREFQVFIDKLEQAIDTQRRLVEEMEARCQQARQSWQERHTRTRAIGNAVEQKRNDERAREARQEQRQLDDRVLRRE